VSDHETTTPPTEPSIDKHPRAPKELRTRLVEVVRLIFIALLGTAGLYVARSLGQETPTKTLLGVFLGVLGVDAGDQLISC
jgi:hypothetical protein